METYRLKEGRGAWQEYQYRCTPRAQELIHEVERLEKLNITLFPKLMLPSSWDRMSFKKRKQFFLSNTVDVEIESIYCEGSGTVSDSDILALSEFGSATTLF